MTVALLSGVAIIGWPLATTTLTFLCHALFSPRLTLSLMGPFKDTDAPWRLIVVWMFSQNAFWKIWRWHWWFCCLWGNCDVSKKIKLTQFFDKGSYLAVHSNPHRRRNQWRSPFDDSWTVSLYVFALRGGFPWVFLMRRSLSLEILFEILSFAQSKRSNELVLARVLYTITQVTVFLMLWYCPSMDKLTPQPVCFAQNISLLLIDLFWMSIWQFAFQSRFWIKREFQWKFF